MRPYSTEDVLRVIRREIAKSSLRQVARDKGLSAAILSKITTGNRGISQSVALAFGFSRVVQTVVRFYKSGPGRKMDTPAPS